MITATKSDTVYFSNFAVDTVPINVTVHSIQNTTYTSNKVPLNFTVGKAVTWAAYSLDGQANVTMPQNTTLTGLATGAHTLTVFAQDVIGLIEASNTVSFAVADNTVVDSTESADSTLPEFRSTLVIAFALALISAVVVSLKIRRGRKNSNNGSRVLVRASLK